MFMIDNQALVAILIKGYSKCPAINLLLRKLAVVATVNSFTYSATWIPSKANIYGDSLSRGQFDLFQSLAPAAKKITCPSPEDIQLTYTKQQFSTNIKP